MLEIMDTAGTEQFSTYNMQWPMENVANPKQPP